MKIHFILLKGKLKDTENTKEKDKLTNKDKIMDRHKEK